jgi:hypothetical protein
MLSFLSLSFLYAVEDIQSQVKLVKSPLESDIVLLLTLSLSAVTLPSLMAMVYLGALLVVVLPRAAAAYPARPSSMSLFIIVMMAYTSINMVLFYLFQFDFFQNSANLNNARLFGLINLVNTTDISSQHAPIELHLGHFSWPSWIHPFAVLSLYIVLVRCLIFLLLLLTPSRPTITSS